jgi:Na+-transporting NADH:ubiquinone oxidoreductase subunit A
MQRVKVKKGLDLPIEGSPEQEIHDARPVRSVALVGPDYVGMRPGMLVQVGDQVKEGSPLFADKKNPGVQYTAPGCGRIVAINRGDKRALQSVVIELEGDEHEEFDVFAASQLERLDPGKIKENLVASGLWTALRTRPFSRVPPPESSPRSIFVTALDTNPLAGDAGLIVDQRPDDFTHGLAILSRLTDGKLFLCVKPGSAIPGSDLPGVETVEFDGPHPAGLPGTHIHFLDPVSRQKTVWHVNYQDVMAMGSLFTTGRLDHQRFISLAGPAVKNPRLLRTRLGANTDEIAEGELTDGQNRVVSGSVLFGRKAEGPLAFLGRYHLQITALPECTERKLFGWISPGLDRYSVTNTFASRLIPGKRFAMSTAAYGDGRAVVPIGSYEKVMPLDILPTFLLRALAVDDVEQAEALGCLELDEEDMALCTFVCPGKGDYGALLRRNLTIIEKEG